MVLILLVVFGGLVALWWLVGMAVEALMDRHIRLPARVAGLVQPGRLPAYARQDQPPTPPSPAPVSSPTPRSKGGPSSWT
ncbi:hypothetical protein [Streptomyces sp. SHP 1-2]|uniref:hypothetical protein n=1 Tax=Streptomyces sp. SHP 1-2 TaxID=2769489 RepID=UPI002238DABF|nr:hypothetical protein [Streptomyces sp. SHP 1-2]MCW5252242.1 hypothetical protein [Streptomyces sp. SHP 1-2]